MYDEITIALTMHCWLNMSTGRTNHKYVVYFLHQLFGRMPMDTPLDVLDKAIDVVTADTIILRIKQVLLDPNMIDEAIEDELYALKPFIVTDRPCIQIFIQGRVYHSVAQALERQLRVGSPQFSRAVLHARCLLISYVLTIQCALSHFL